MRQRHRRGSARSDISSRARPRQALPDVRRQSTIRRRARSSERVALAPPTRRARRFSAARAAFPAWAATPPLQRARVMFRFKALLDAQSTSWRASSRASTARCCRMRAVKSRAASKSSSSPAAFRTCSRASSPTASARGIDSWSLRQPLGVCAGITPFNFPAMVPMWMFPIAIACGNTFVLKPSEKDPSCALRLAELLNEAGLPAGVFNVVNGDREAVDDAADRSGRRGGQLRRFDARCAVHLRDGVAHGKRVQALGGAKNHMVVMPDADPSWPRRR